MAKYAKTSPWSDTRQNNFYRYVIENQYRHRPDLLAYDIYGNAKLWWVFVQRNMSVIKDPIYDFEPGTVIYLPKKTNLAKFLGV